MHVIILHGIQSHSGDHWQRWLAHELEVRKHTVYMPELPNPAHPDRFEWLRYVKELLKKAPTSNLLLIGHSLGVVSALDFIEQSDKKVHGLISISGFAADYGADMNGYFMRQKELYFSAVNDHLAKAFILYGDNDPYVPQETLENLAALLDVTPKIITEGGHLNIASEYSEFSLLMDLVKNWKRKNHEHVETN